MMVQDLGDTARAVLSEKFIAVQAYVKKQEKYQIKQSILTSKGTRKQQSPILVKGRKLKDHSRNKRNIDLKK